MGDPMTRMERLKVSSFMFSTAHRLPKIHARNWLAHLISQIQNPRKSLKSTSGCAIDLED
jgi:hypothetical protein